MIDDNGLIEIPPIECGQYLLDVLYDIGPVVRTEMGDVAVRSEHIIPWQQETGIILQPWEARTIRRLSYDYLAQAQQSTKPGCPPPYGPVASRAAVAKKIDAIFG